jgi:hypothetical protein
MARPKSFQQKLEEGWLEKKAERDARRIANREAWAKRRDWSDDNFQKVNAGTAQTASDAAPITSLARLRAIMADPDITLYRRLNAAEVVLSFELAPGAAAGLDPNLIAAASYKFLRAICDASETPEPQRFRALKLVATVENARASAKANDLANTAKRTLLVNLANAERCRQLRTNGQWDNLISANAHWELDNPDQLPWPNGWPGLWQWPPVTFASQLQDAQAADLINQLRQIGSLS